MITSLIQLHLLWDRQDSVARPTSREREVSVGGRVFPIDIARHRWARRYLVRLTEDGRVRLTVPRGASIRDGLAFVEAEQAWILQEWQRLERRLTWTAGSRIWWRGDRVTLERSATGVRCGDETIAVRRHAGDVRRLVQDHFRSVAARQLPARCVELGVAHGLEPARVSVRDQRSRWGACSPRRAITLNWRLIQMPPTVADYVILHELAHLEHPNHSRRFWRKVASICPHWREAERWLRTHGKELM